MIVKNPFILAARFQTGASAEAAVDTVSSLLQSAQKETDALFASQNGIAESCQVAEIFARYGFHNDCGWRQETPLYVNDEAVQWRLPDGMNTSEAEQLLTSLGAVTIYQEESFEDEMLRSVPHPSALFLSEIEELPDFEEDDAQWGDSCEKKILH